LLWTSSLFWLYMVQVCYGFFMAAEVAYYTYIYAKVNKEEYQRVTGYTRASFLAGRFLAATIAQILISLDLMNVRDLNYISFGGLLKFINC
jgi:thiamine transporter 2/3